MRIQIVYFPIYVVLTSTAVHCLTCSDILELPVDKKLTLAELQTLQSIEVIQCLAHLGKEKLPTEEAEFIWKTIVNHFEGIQHIPDNLLTILHWVTVVIKPEEYENITLSNIDVVDNFGLNYHLSAEQLSAIANRVREDFAGKEFEDYTYYDLMALRQILCAFNRSEIERIHPVAYREAALMIGKLENCGEEAMSGFATLAITAFGSPKKWTEATIKTMGKVAEYLPHELVTRFQVQRGESEES